MSEADQPDSHWAQDHIDAGKPIPGTVEKLYRQYDKESQYGDAAGDELEPEIKDFMKSNPHLKGTTWDELSKIDARNYVLYNPSTGKAEEADDPSDGSWDQAIDALQGMDNASRLNQGTHDGVEHDVALANLQGLAYDTTAEHTEDADPYTREHAQDFAKAHSHKSAEEIMYDVNQFKTNAQYGNPGYDDGIDQMVSRIHNHKEYFDGHGAHSDENEWHDDFRDDEYKNEQKIEAHFDSVKNKDRN